MSQYVIVDLEMCKVPKKSRREDYRLSQETIQIGAVLLNDQYEIVDEFNSYVSPAYGNVDATIVRLTGITAWDLKGAPSMDAAIENFAGWIPEGAQVVSWSESDLRQIQRECEVKGITNDRFEDMFENWIDCQKMFSEKLKDGRKYKLSEALIVADIIQEGQEHNGLVDACNTAKLFAKMMREPEMKLNRIFVNARSEETETLSFSMGDLFKNVHLS